MRLQGIDAPELHYRPVAVRKRQKGGPDPAYDAYLKLNEEYRQHWAESAAATLGNFLAKANQEPLPCTVETYVDEPNDVFDVYGRFVGDIVVRIKKESSEPVNVNKWLVRKGLAVPAFYTSMSPAEINALLVEAKKAGQKGVWPLERKAGRLDRSLVYRKPPATVVPDKGPVIHPKLFRRLSTWDVNYDANMLTASFVKYLQEHKDACFETKEFLEHGLSASTPRFLHEFVEADGDVKFRAQNLVFQESQSTLVGTSGKRVTKW